MDIKKLDNITNKSVNQTNKSSEEAGSQKSASKTINAPKDKISLDDYQFRNNDKLFAELELEKLNDSSSQRFNEVKSQVSAFLKASEQSSDAAHKTEMGQKINNPDIWGDIARKILQ